MNHFKGKQFQQDVIIVAVGYYLRYNLSYREVQSYMIEALTFLIRRFIVGCKNMANYSIKFGKRKIKNPFIWWASIFLTEIYPILNSVKKKEESKKSILNKPKL